jgi:hypothetical protein
LSSRGRRIPRKTSFRDPVDEVVFVVGNVEQDVDMGINKVILGNALSTVTFRSMQWDMREP